MGRTTLNAYNPSLVGTIIQGDCLDVMKRIPNGSVDMVLCDLPYGTTSNKWDSVIPLEPLWVQYLRVCKQTAAIVLTASQPFTAVLLTSRLDLFRHEWIWLKDKGSNFANTVREPMKEHESVLVFSRGKWMYNRQMQERTGTGAARVKHELNFRSQSENYREFEGRESQTRPELRVPSSWQKWNAPREGLHPTQKPVDMFRYFIRTYSEPNEIILDNCIGSGTTAVAAMLEGRQFIGIEKEQKYVDIAYQRLVGECM